MKTLLLEIEDDGTFSGRITLDGVVAASVSGNAEICTVAGAAHEFANLLRVIAGQSWKTTLNDQREYWLAFYSPTYGNGFLTPALGYFHGFESEAAAVSASTRLRDMWPALVKPPEALYEAFHTDGEGWGYFDRAGTLHATFPSQQAAQEVARKR